MLDLKIDRRSEGEGRHQKEGVLKRVPEEGMLKNRPAFTFLRLPELLEPWGCHEIHPLHPSPHRETGWCEWGLFSDWPRAL